MPNVSQLKSVGSSEEFCLMSAMKGICCTTQRSWPLALFLHLHMKSCNTPEESGIEMLPARKEDPD